MKKSINERVQVANFFIVEAHFAGARPPCGSNSQASAVRRLLACRLACFLRRGPAPSRHVGSRCRSRGSFFLVITEDGASASELFGSSRWPVHDGTGRKGGTIFFVLFEFHPFLFFFFFFLTFSLPFPG